MKKALIVVGTVVALVALWLIVKSVSAPPAADTANTQPTSTEPQVTLKPFEITVGLFDQADEPGKLTKLLESRLREIGFRVTIFQEFVDPNAAEQEKTTLLFRPNSATALKVVEREMMSSSLYRQGQNEAITEDVIFSAWNIEDINWGSFQALADQYNNPQSADVSVQVVNAGAPEGAAAALVEQLKAAGYEQAAAADAPEDELAADQPALIYYQRNYKNAAKALRQVIDERYDNVSYRFELVQPANIVIVLGPPAGQTSSDTATSTEE